MKTIKHALIVICSTISLLGCTTNHNVTARSASLFVGGGLTLDVYEISENTARMRLLGPRREIYGHSKCKVQEDDLAVFWQTLNDAAIDKWLPKYEARSNDGRTHKTNWEIIIVSQGRTLQSRGEGAFPSDNDPKKSIDFDPGDRFQRVYDAFERVCKSKSP